MIDKIYITTLGRPNHQITFNNLPKRYKDMTTLVVQKFERKLYDYDCNYLVVDDDIGIGATREIVIKDGGEKKYAIYDDDLSFFRRNSKYWSSVSNMDKSKREFTDSDFDDMFNTFSQWLDSGVVSCNSRLELLPPKGKQFNDNGMRPYSNFYINGSKLFQFTDDWDLSYIRDVCEDNHLLLLIFTNGLRNRISDEFCVRNHSKDKGSLPDTGIWNKTVDEVLKQYNKLSDRWPGLVTLKKSKLGYKGFPQIKISWKKAYESSQINTLEEFMQ